MNNKIFAVLFACLILGAWNYFGVDFINQSNLVSAAKIERRLQSVPETFTYQGYLEEGGGPANGSYPMVFALYTSASGGSALSGASVSLITPVNDGVFTVDLDFNNTVYDQNLLYLQVSVNGVPMLPRQKLNSVPYAFQAESAMSAERATLADNVAWEDITGMPADLTGGNNHDHSGAVWSASRPGGAILELKNTSNNSKSSALYISGAGDDGIHINGTGESAVWVESAGENGIQVDSAGHSGVYVGNAARNGIQIKNADDYGIYVENSDGGMDAAARFNGAIIVTGGIYRCANTNGSPNPACLITSRGPELSEENSPDSPQLGNIILDENGEGVVSVPLGFETQYLDFNYDLTAIGKYSPLYIAEELQNGSFKIAGGEKGMKVSWQIVGIQGPDQ